MRAETVNLSEKLSFAAIHDCRTEIDSVISGLQGAAVRAGKRFLDIGNDLRDLHEHAGQLAQLTGNTARLIGHGSGDGFLAYIDALSNNSLSSLSKSQDRFATSLERIGEIQKIMETLPLKNRQLERTGKKLRVIGMNIRVESSRSGIAQEAFAAFVEDLDNLVNRTIHITNEIRSNVHTANDRQNKVRGRIDAGREDLEVLVEQARENITSTAEKSSDLLEVSAEELRRTTERTQIIQQLISEIVTAIQIDDIVRQRLEHIVHALDELSMEMSKLEKGSADLESANAWCGHAHAVLTVQMAQLKDTIDELERASSTLRRSFLQIGVEIGQLVAESDSSGFDISGNELTTHFDQLKQVLEKMGIIFAKVSELDNLTKTAAEEVAESSSILARHIDEIIDISIDMQLQALNAIVKSVRLGDDGRTLQILSHEVTQLADGSNKFVQDVVTDLGYINTTAKALEDSSTEKTGEKFDFGQSNDFRADLRQVSQGCESYNDLVTEASEKSIALESSIGETEKNLAFLSELMTDMRSYIPLLQKNIELFSPYAGETFARNEHVGILKQAYTMASERIVHDTVSIDRSRKAGIQKMAEQAVGVVEPSGGDSEFDDNIELF
ncbi:MAG: hypothetical protein R3F48_12975 [Candidatus Zixiibacteriota bacterium]